MTNPSHAGTGRGGKNRGVFIVIEGIDGAGTTTQCERYAAHIRKRGRSAHVTREPSDGPVGVLIRMMLRKEIAPRSRTSAEMMALLFAADRLDHVLSEVDAELERGSIVISDRYALSSLAYQSAASADGSDEKKVSWIRSLNQFAKKPEVTLVVDVAADVARERRLSRGGGEELYEAAALQARLADIYLHAEELLPGERVVHVEGAGTVAEVEARIIAALDPIVEASW
jgi:dTMP kinase